MHAACLTVHKSWFRTIQLIIPVIQQKRVVVITATFSFRFSSLTCLLLVLFLFFWSGIHVLACHHKSMHESGLKLSIDLPSMFSISRSFKVSFPSDDRLLTLINLRTENILSSFPMETGNENNN